MAGEENAFAVTDIITHVIYVRQGDVWPCIDAVSYTHLTLPTILLV